MELAGQIDILYFVIISNRKILKNVCCSYYDEILFISVVYMLYNQYLVKLLRKWESIFNLDMLLAANLANTKLCKNNPKMT